MSVPETTPADAFIQLLDPDPEKAAEKYALLFHQLTKFFEWRDCADPEELAAITLGRGFAKIAAGTTIFAPHPAAYFYGIAKNVLREERRAMRRDRPVSVSADAGAVSSWKDVNATEARICLQQCLERLSVAERDLVLRYFDDDRARLSHDLGLSPTALRVRVHRIKKRLMDLVRLDAQRRRNK